MNDILKHPIPAVRSMDLDEHNKVLLLQRSPTTLYPGWWCLPGGKVEYGQSTEAALSKELWEETGLRCTGHRFLFYQDNLPKDHSDAHYISLYFECQTEGDVVLNRESSGFSWVGLTEITKYMIAFGNDEAIQRYFTEYQP